MNNDNKQVIETVISDPELLTEVLNTQAAQEIIIQQAVSVHHGPLPPAREMAEYSKHIPDFGNRVMKYAEDAQNKRFELNKKALTIKSMGLWFGLLSVFIVASFCFYLVSQGEAGLGATVMISVLAAIAGVFVVGKKIEPSKSNNQNNE